MTDALATHPHAQLVPASYAEKAMASLMQLHAELMDEKERRVDLFRRLMEREQSLAEIKLYVKVLEERLAAKPVAAAAPARPEEAPRAVAPTPVAAARPEARPAPEVAAPPRVPAMPAPVTARPRLDGWKTW